MTLGPQHRGAAWLAKPPSSGSPPRRGSSSSNWPPLVPRLRGWLCGPASSSAAPPRAAACPATTRWPPPWAATPTPSPAGGTASAPAACRACPTPRGAAGRGLFPPEERHQVLVLATTRPAEADTPVSHWSLDELALRILRDAHYRDMSRSTVQRILAEAELKPHKVRSWMHAEDPAFEEQALALCRLYLRAPALYRQGEMVLCTDEKTGIQALERAWPGKPARPGYVELREPEYIRHGTRCLLATFVVPTGWVYGDVTARRTNQDFRAHLRHTVARLVQRYPHVPKVHWVMDTLYPHRSLEVCRLCAHLNGLKFEPKKLKRGPQRGAFLTDPEHRQVIHFTPKHGSWLNQVELWFSVLARRVIRRGDFASKADLARKILAYIAYHNTFRAHPYAWTYTGKPLVSGAEAKKKPKR